MPQVLITGYDHGCSDAGISDPSYRYINEPGKGPSDHTDAFMNGYNTGISSCSSSYETPVPQSSSPQSTISNSQPKCNPLGQAAGGGIGALVGESILPGVGGAILGPIGSAIGGGNCPN
jgi:hypothetical protein